jgi:competence protein ComEA
MKKKWWKAYIHSSNLERKGTIALAVIVLLLFITWRLVPYFVHPPSLGNDKELQLAWNEFKSKHVKNSSDSNFGNNETQAAKSLFAFDPNTLDSNGFIRLGLAAKTTHYLLNWRRKGKHFYEKRDLRELYTLSAEQFNELEPFIRIQSKPGEINYDRRYAQEKPLPSVIDLNNTDSATLVRLNGIGPVLAHKIIQKRNQLGGFLKHEQLKEIYTFPDTTFKMLCQRLAINERSVRKLNLNSADLTQLQTHPYIGEKTARNIILYREGAKRFERIDQLRQVPLMNEEIYRKIAPYFTLE